MALLRYFLCILIYQDYNTNKEKIKQLLFRARAGFCSANDTANYANISADAKNGTTSGGAII